MNKTILQQRQRAEAVGVQQSMAEMHERMADEKPVPVTARDVRRARIEFEQAIKGARDALFNQLPVGPLDAGHVSRAQASVELARLAYEDVRDRYRQQEDDAAAVRSESWLRLTSG